MKRVTYKKHPTKDNLYFTKQFVTDTAKLINGTIIKRENLEFQVIIHELNEGIVLYDEVCKSFNAAKHCVKKKFIEFGVKIDAELRKKIKEGDIV